MNNPNQTQLLVGALSLWMQTHVIPSIKNHPDLMADIKACLEGDGELHIVYSTRAATISVIADNYAKQASAELYRQTIAPEDARFALLADSIQ